MIISWRGRLGIISILLISLLAVFLIGCAPVKETVKKTSVVDATELYKDEFQRFSAGLSAKIDAGFKKDFMERGPGPVILTFKAAEWNSFYDRLNFALSEQLGNTDIQFVKPDWEFSEGIFSELKCPEELILPEYKTIISVRHYKKSKEFLAIADARRLGSRLDIKGFPATSPIGGVYYSNALADWEEKQKRPGMVEGSPEKPYQSYKKAGTFLARLIECKMSLASDLWKKSTPSGSAIDFQHLKYRMLGLRPSPGVSNIRAIKIAKAVYQELKDTGIKVVADELDMETITAEIDKYDKFQEFYFEGKEAGEFQIVPGQAFVVGDVISDESDRQRLEVSLRTVLGTRVVNGLPSQGIVIPALGGTIYVRVKDGGDMCTTLHNRLTRFKSPVVQQSRDNFQVYSYSKPHYYLYEVSQGLFSRKWYKEEQPFGTISVPDGKWIFIASSDVLPGAKGKLSVEEILQLLIHYKQSVEIYFNCD